MPFTLAHAGIMPVFKKIAPQWLSLTGLMAGAMTPDLQYFLLMTTEFRGLSHSWAGLALFCLPVGVAFALAFHGLFKYYVILNLPALLDRHFSGLAVSRFTPRSARAWAVLAVSVMIGSVSHFAWDSFTHPWGELTKFLPWLLDRVELFGHPRQVNRIIQHVSTLSGIGLLVLFAWKGNILPPPAPLPRRTPGRKWAFWMAAGSFATVFAVVVTCVYQVFLPDHAAWPFATFGLAGFAGFFWFTVGYSLLNRTGRQVTGIPMGDRKSRPEGSRSGRDTL